MKIRNGRGDALDTSRQIPAGTRFLTAAFVALAIIAGLDIIFPSFKRQIIPGQSIQPTAGPGRILKPFEWSQVCAEHS